MELKILTPEHLLEIAKWPSAAVRVYLAHIARENLGGQSWPSLDTLCEDTGLSLRTVKVARKWLVEHGKLTKVDEIQPRNHGKYAVPVMMSTVETAVVQDLTAVGQFTVGQKLHPEEILDLDFDLALNRDPQQAIEGVSNLESAQAPSMASFEKRVEEQNQNQNQNQNQQGSISHGRKQQFGKDGTPWTEEMYSRDYSSAKRLAWVLEHNGEPMHKAISPEAKAQAEVEAQVVMVMDSVCSCGNGYDSNDFFRNKDDPRCSACQDGVGPTF